jgi:spore germination protein
MEIYVVQQGDTIHSIAQKFDISAEKLITDNGIQAFGQLAVGQTLVIAHPELVYIVKDGDTLSDIAEAHGVTVMQLLQNNPRLINRQYIYPGEQLTISYNNNLGQLWTVGYTYPFINEDILRMTLPYLTYLLIFNYRISDEGELIGGDEDIAVIRTAELFGTVSTLVVTAFSQMGEISLEMVTEILTSQLLQDKLIDNLLRILKEKDYSGVNIGFQFISEANQQLYLDFLSKIVNSLHPEGYAVYLTINPGLTYIGEEVTFEKINYTNFSNMSDGILFLSYDWGTTERPPIQVSIITTKPLLDYIVSLVPLEKIRIALPTLGYDWQLPFEQGKTKANALNFDSALALAVDMNAVIQFDENTLSAYFEYTDINEQQHIVWFKDARSIDSSLKILQSYGINGVGIWNIMFYFAQLWLVINSQYQIVKTSGEYE